ncbi:MAG: AIR synthase-related protein, partial [Pontimonas sp.]
IDITEALFSESVARMVVSVAREDDVKFRGLCEGRGVPVARIGVTDLSAKGLDVADQFSFTLEELDALHRGTLPAVLGPVVGYSA